MNQQSLNSPRQSNNRKLNRFNKTVQLHKHSISDISSKDTMKIAAINSITYGVKHNDLSYLTERGLGKLRKDPQQSNDLLFDSADSNLKKIRVKYDRVRSQNQQLQKKVRKLTDQVLKYKKTEQEFSNQKQSGNNDVQNLSQGLTNKQYDFTQKDIEKKVFEQMRDRYKKEKVFYDQKKFDMQKQLKFIKKQSQLYKADGKSIIQQSDRSQKLYNKLVQALSEQQRQRVQHVTSVQTMIEQKRQVMISGQTRKLQVHQIAERALQDRDQTEKNWEKLFLAQKFVNKMLTNKIYKQMEKFSVVQTAFKNIKISTGVSQANNFVYKFLNKEIVYGQLLGKIADNQTKITQLKIEADELYKDNKQLQQQQKQLHQMRKKQTINLHGQNKALEQYDMKQQNNQLQKNKIRFWLIKNIKKFKLLGQSIQKINISNSLADVGILFKAYLNMLVKVFQETKDFKLQQENNTQNQVTPKMVSKVYRVRTNNRRKNSIGEQIDDNIQEQRITNPQQENDSVEHSRTEVHKQNQKFMKMLKLKYEEIRRAKIQAMPKQKKKQPQKPKIVEPVE